MNHSLIDRNQDSTGKAQPSTTMLDMEVPSSCLPSMVSSFRVYYCLAYGHRIQLRVELDRVW
jgi:hypothetical protein